jgi:hypothetical protein
MGVSERTVIDDDVGQCEPMKMNVLCWDDPGRSFSISWRSSWSE